LHDKHRDLLGAVNGINMPDLSPFHEHFNVVGDHMSQHKTKVTSIESRLSSLEKNDQDQRHLLEMILQRLPQDLDKQLKNVQAEQKASRAAVQKDMETLVDVVQADVRGIQKDVQQLRLDVSSTVASLDKEVRKLQQAAAESSKQAAAGLRQSSAEVVAAVRQLGGAPGLEEITGGVIDKLKKIRLQTDHSPILAALECVPDLHQRVCHMHDKVSTSNVHYDPADVLKAIGKIKQAPDHDTIASAVHDRISRANLKVDTSELMRALSKIDLEKHFEAHSGVIDGKLRKHSGDILKAVSTMPDHDTIVNAMHERLKTVTLNVDHGELKQMIRRIPTEHDHDALASAVHERIGGSIANAGNHSKILSAIGSLKLDPDLTIVLEAIEAMEESVVTTLLEAIRGIDMQVMCKGSLPASMAPRIQNGSAKVREAYGGTRQKQLTAPPEAGRLLDSEDQLAVSAKSSVSRDPPSPRPSKSKFDRSTSAGPTSSRAMSSSTPQEYEVPTSEGPIWACICGFTCGTQSALERHMTRFAGQRGHRPVA